ncbi:MAG: FimB/Mfa2 family fimbrial subunit [Muribaculaceae bacterium]|nr:FimB/Mfa2 family fimbrial subunit [Muribaculaceae bacterium]
MRLSLSNIAKSFLSLCTTFALCSCSLIFEDRGDCPEGLYVRFVYDYNTLRADLFKDHVNHIRLYIYDKRGNLVAQRSVSNTADNAPLAPYGYTMHFPESELPAGHKYRLQAVGLQRDWDEALSKEGASYRFTTSPSEHSESMTISLDHNTEPVKGTQQFAVDPSAPLDTLWHTLKVTAHEPKDGLAIPGLDRTSAPYSVYPLEDQLVEIKHEHATYATVSLVRDTKHLNLTLRHVDSPETVFADDYEVKIIDNNAHLAHDNSILTHDSVRYTPYASWTSRVLDDNTVEIEQVHTGNPGQYSPRGEKDNRTVLQRTAHYNLMFNRIMLNPDDNQDNAMLEIHNRQNGNLVARVNLPYILSQGRQAFEIQNYGQQEYLDREYDYRLDFFLKGDEWIMIELHVLSWSKRIQNIEI